MKFAKCVNVKVGKMRKPDSCVVYPYPINNIALVQGNRLIMRVNLLTGAGVANYSTGSDYPRPTHLSHGNKGVMLVAVDAGTLESIKNAVSSPGDYLGSSVCRIS